MKIKKLVMYTACTVLATISLSGCELDDDPKTKSLDNNDQVDQTQLESYKIRTSTYAESQDISYEESEHRLKTMDEAAKVFPRLEEHFRDSIAGIYFTHGDDFGLTVRTTRKDGLNVLDHQLMDEIEKDMGMPLRIEFNSPKNSNEIQEMLTREVGTLSEQMQNFQSVGYDPKSGEIVIEVNDENMGIARNSVREYDMTEMEGMPVRIDPMRGPIEPAVLAGGGQLRGYLTAGGTTKCTAGFSGFASDRVTPAIITAYHCLYNMPSTPNNYVSRFNYIDNNGITHGLTPTPQAVSGNHDMTLLLAPKGTSITGGTYLGDTSGPVPIRGSATPSSLVPTQSYLCHYGRTTGFSCGTVQKLYVSVAAVSAGIKICNTSNKSCNPTFITISDWELRCDGGDSGGPVVSGNTAYGIVSSCNLNGIAAGEKPILYLSSISYINELPAFLAVSQS